MMLFGGVGREGNSKSTKKEETSEAENFRRNPLLCRHNFVVSRPPSGKSYQVKDLATGGNSDFSPFFPVRSVEEFFEKLFFSLFPASEKSR
jgi:hypothetical protein